MYPEVFISASLAVLLFAGAGESALSRMGVSRRDALFLLLSAAALSGFTLEIAEGVFVSPACVLLSAAFALLSLRRKGARIPALFAACAASVLCAPIVAYLGPFAPYAAGLLCALTAFVPAVSPRGALAACGLAPVLGYAAACFLPGGVPLFELTHDCVSAQLISLAFLILFASLSIIRTHVRKPSAGRTIP